MISEWPTDARFSPITILFHRLSVTIPTWADDTKRVGKDSAVLAKMPDVRRASLVRTGPHIGYHKVAFRLQF